MRRQHAEVRGRLASVVVVEHDRQHFAHGRAGPAAFGKRSASAEHQQAAAALVHEVGNHPELVGRERRGFDAAENQAAILEQLLARLREAAHHFIRRRHVAAEVFVLGGPLQQDDADVLVVLDGAQDELRFGARLALVIEHLLAPVAHFEQRVTRVVLRDFLAVLRRDAEAEQPRARFVRREPHACGQRLAVGRQRHLLGGDDAAAVFDVERHALARVARLRDDDVDDERGAFEDEAWRFHAGDLHVVREAFLAEADGEDRNRARLEACERIVDRRVGRVSAVGDHHEAGERQARQLVARAFERVAEFRRRAVVVRVRRGGDASGG